MECQNNIHHFTYNNSRSFSSRPLNLKQIKNNKSTYLEQEHRDAPFPKHFDQHRNIPLIHLKQTNENKIEIKM